MARLTNSPEGNSLRNLRRASREEIADLLRDGGEPSYRVRQLREWLARGETSWEKMSNLSHVLIAKLRERYYLTELGRDHQEDSTDGTVKMRFRTEEGYFLESVYIPSGERNTLCVSSQIGCSLNCRFCATARMERKRNLHSDEIFDQFRWGQEISIERSGKPLTNLVFMGMGEPLLNYEEVLQAIFLITDPQGFVSETGKGSSPRKTAEFSPKRITVSTAGIAAGIRRLGEDRVPFDLALSLHASTDEKRSRIMMNNPRNNLKELRSALEYFYQQTGNKITLEYLLLDKFNDGEEDARDLVRFYRRVPAQLVNLIEYNPVPGIEFSQPDTKTFSHFREYLESRGVNVRVRRSRGKDIAAACGQLANEEIVSR